MANGKPFMLTTIDNPWNPFKNWDEWFAFDRQHGYDTPGYLARITRMSIDLSDADQEQVISNAIDEIVQLNIRGIYKKISPDDQINPSKVGGGV